MLKPLSFAIAALLSAQTIQAHTATKADLAGEWCMYDSVYSGSSHPAEESYVFNTDGTYFYKVAIYEQNGHWELADSGLRLSEIGIYRISKLDENLMEADFGVHMKFRRGSCQPEQKPRSIFNYQDTAHTPEEHLTRFQNAAATGELNVLQDYIDTGINVNEKDGKRGETALIIAAKFCHPNAIKLLLDAGADKSLTSKKGQTAHDWALSSRYHKGCPVGVSLL